MSNGTLYGAPFKDNNYIGMQRTVLVDFDERMLVRAAMETSKFHK